VFSNLNVTEVDTVYASYCETDGVCYKVVEDAIAAIAEDCETELNFDEEDDA
jgi:hypothetical protein